MNKLSRSATLPRILSLLAIATAGAGAQAQTTPVGTGINPNTFIVGHPASPTWKRAHSHAEHPAVQVRARQGVASIDSNTFRVQPPASTRWTVQPQTLVLARLPG